jgi:hypothetical protein
MTAIAIDLVILVPLLYRQIRVSRWLAAGGWRLAAGGWRLAAGGWRLAAGGWRLR